MPKTTLLGDYSVTCPNHFRNITPRVRVVAIDDGSFDATLKDRQTALFVAVLWSNMRISAIRVGHVRVDGRDSNCRLRSVLRSLQFDVIFISGLSLAGFNLVDIAKLARDTHRPVVAVTGDKPNNKAVKTALHHFADWRIRLKIVLNAGRLYSCKPLKNEPKLYFEVRGGSPHYARGIIEATSMISRLPEPIRIARIIARGLSRNVDTKSPKSP